MGTDVYTYDGVGRLRTATVNGTANSQTFTYDEYGNRTSAVRSPSSSPCIGSTGCENNIPVDSSTNRLQNTSYDAAGNVTAVDSTYTYSYDAEGMVKQSSGGGLTQAATRAGRRPRRERRAREARG